jgi:regulation of enolase protein 1 (concanavalin A-like superfamily)
MSGAGGLEQAYDLVSARDLTIAAGGTSDHFIDPSTSRATLNAPRVLGRVPGTGDFQLSAQVEVEFEATFDAGVLMLWADDLTWAKLCFEYSPSGQPMVVSVVTRGLSDDANSTPVDGNQVWLRASRSGASYAFHACTDGQTWEFVRHFALPADPASLRVGFSSQSPTGAGCVSHFTQVRFVAEPLTDLRDGS